MLPLFLPLIAIPFLTGPQDTPTVDSVEDDAAAAMDDVKDEAEAARDAATEEQEEKGWEGSWTLSASKTYGNTDIQTFALGLDAVLEEKPSRYTIGISSNYSDENDELV